MNCKEEYAKLCDEIDEKLISILKASKEYVEKRNEFLEVWRDGIFDLTMGSNLRLGGKKDRYAFDASFEAIYKLYCENGECSIREVKEEKQGSSTPQTPKQKVEESELRHRKGEKGEKEGWVESEIKADEENDAAEKAFEERIIQTKRDPLYILNPLPTASQRKAQKTLRKSMTQLAELCQLQRDILHAIDEYSLLISKKEAIKA